MRSPGMVVGEEPAGFQVRRERNPCAQPNEGCPVPVGDEAVTVVGGDEGRLGTGRWLHTRYDEPHQRGVGLTLEGGVGGLGHDGGAILPVGDRRQVRLRYGLDLVTQAGVCQMVTEKRTSISRQTSLRAWA